jgi:antitoxin HicB
MKQVYTYTIQLEPEEGGRFTVTVPSLPGCVTWGRDYDHALEAATATCGTKRGG